MIVGTEKRCSKCRIVQPIEQFSPSRSTADGRNGWCKKCKREREREKRYDPEVIRARTIRYETDLAYRATRIVRACSKRSKQYGLQFDLDTEWLLPKLKAGTCELTGLRFDVTMNNRRPNARTPSIDRIDPKLGYVKSNCRVVLFAINAALNEWGLEEFLPIAEALVYSTHKAKAA